MRDDNRTAPAAAHTRWWETADAIFGIPLLAAIALQLVLPISLPQGVLTPAMLPGGLALIVMGIVLIVLARREFARHGQPTDPGRPTSSIVSTGVFSISRNPIYLGAACILIGISLAAGLAWLLVLLVPAIVACHYVLIAPEERYLAAKFGQHYRSYAISVHRWVGRARRPR
ncbi:MAG TPA: isoprenylcysteine carboxylmethyltransferase family protein [Roseiflexaceae bacterium]|nr:isoprenylcysteine carboxylmethyltransferase family protein [Roseiflexaceae bacterium]